MYIEGVVINYKWKLEGMEQYSLLGMAYRTQKEITQCDESCWLNAVNAMIDNVSKGNKGRANGDKKKIIRSLQEDYKCNWRKDLRNSNMGGNGNSSKWWHSKFKKVMKSEQYLNGPRFDVQIAMARLRLGLHGLPVETGNWAKQKFVECKCDRCSLNKVGTIVHCFMCPGNNKWLKPRGILRMSEKKLIQDYEKSVGVGKTGYQGFSQLIQVSCPLLCNLCKTLRKCKLDFTVV